MISIYFSQLLVYLSVKFDVSWNQKMKGIARKSLFFSVAHIPNLFFLENKKTRFTISNPRVRRLKVQVARLKAPVGRLKALVEAIKPQVQ